MANCMHVKTNDTVKLIMHDGSSITKRVLRALGGTVILEDMEFIKYKATNGMPLINKNSIQLKGSPAADSRIEPL